MSAARRPKRPIGAQLDDPTAERVRRSHADAIRELQAAPAVLALGDVVLANAVDVVVPHRLGREPEQIIVGPPRDATSASALAAGPGSTGRIVEVRSGSYDLTQVVVLKATGWGTTVTAKVSVL